MKLQELVDTSRALAATPGRLDKIATLANLLGRVPPGEVPIAVGFLTGAPRQGRLGIGWATVSSVRDRAAAAESTLELGELDETFSRLLSITGKNSNSTRASIIEKLFARSTATEQDFLAALLTGQLRQGALEGVLVEAVAKAAGAPSDDVRRAVMLAGDLGAVAADLLGGATAADALDAYGLRLFRPIQPMLADSAANVRDALSAGEPLALEWKVDGARIQLHRRGDEVAIYTRNLNDVTARLPEVVEAARALPGTEQILDGEVIALDPHGRPRSFQTTMRRFGRSLDVEAMRAELPLNPFFFDLLLNDGESLIDEPFSTRVTTLDRVVPEELRVPRIITADPEKAEHFEADAKARGHEGVMVKSLDAPYAAGRRGSAWKKVKTARTLDLVVLGAEWGSGRRKGWLSNLHIGARDPDGGDFVMLGKTFKGMTDKMLEWQTEELLKLAVRREGHIVYVRPELVVEIAFNEVQRSSQYPGGVTLRFARVKGYRPDRTPEDADTIEAVRAFLD